MSIVDAHVHFWDPRQTPRAVTPLVRALGFSPRLVDWVARRLFPRDALRFYASPQFITRPYLPADLERDRGPVAVRSVVHVEAGWEGRGPFAPVEETRWVAGQGAAGAWPIGAIVARADLGLGTAVAAVLRAHLEASDRVRGIRDILAWHPSPSVMNSARTPGKARDPQWRLGFERLSDWNLRFEAACYDHQLPELVDLARAYPEQPVVLCHAGTPVAVGGPFGACGHTPAERDRTFGCWRENMARLAECGNVAVKISGLTMPVCGFGFENRSAPPSVDEVCDALRPLVGFVLNTFGARRCLFASNYPVEKVAVPYGVLWGAYERLVDEFSETERGRVLRDNAARLYDIRPAPAEQ